MFSNSSMGRLVFILCCWALCAIQTAEAARREVDPNKTLVIWKASFADDLSASDAVKNECRMEELLNGYIKSNAPTRGAAIQFAESEAQFAQSPNQLFVFISDVDSNEWSFPRFRPSSLVTFDVKIVIDGSTVKQVRKQIRSGSPFGFGVCQRVDKIAKAGGAFAAEWVARADYQTVAQRTRSPAAVTSAQAATSIPAGQAEQALDAPSADTFKGIESFPSSATDNPVERLEQLELLRNKKLISQEEYDAKRRSIVDAI
jgi:hypothetical protein